MSISIKSLENKYLDLILMNCVFYAKIPDLAKL